MASPYRAEPPPIARYLVRTSPRYLGQIRSALVVSAVVVVIAAFYWAAARTDPAGWILIALAVDVPLCMFVFGSAHFIGGGAGALAIYRDRIEVPRAFRLRPLLVPIAAVEVALERDPTRGPRGVTVDHITGLSIRAPGVKRTLAAGVFERPDLVARAADDIERVRRGLEPQGPEEPIHPGGDPGGPRAEC